MKILPLSCHDIYKGPLILVNQAHGLDESAAEDLIPVTESRPDALLQRPAAQALARLMDEIGGWQHIAFVSAWRSRREQQEIWDDSLRENGPEFTRAYVAVPGHSEHQTGLAMDRFHLPGFPLYRPLSGFPGKRREIRLYPALPRGKRKHHRHQP